MAKLSRKKGTTSYIAHIFIQDSSSTTGAGLTGLTNASSGLVCRYLNPGGTLSAAITLETISTLGTYAAPTSAAHIRFKEISNADPSKGVYEIQAHNDWMNLTGGSILIMLDGATNMAPILLEIELTGPDNQDGVRGGMTALPNAAADAAGGIPISDAGGLDMDAILSRIGTPTNLGGGTATLAANMVDIEAQTDDIGAAGAGLTALGDTRLANLDAVVSSRLATAGYTAPPTAAAIADAVLDETATGHTGALKDVYDNAIQIGAAGAGLTALPAALLATVADGTLTVADSLKLSNAANAGKTAGPVPGSAGTVTLLNTAGTKTRVSTSVDTSGYRTTNTTLDLS